MIILGFFFYKYSSFILWSIKILYLFWSFDNFFDSFLVLKKGFWLLLSNNQIIKEIIKYNTNDILWASADNNWFASVPIAIYIFEFTYKYFLYVYKKFYIPV